MAADRDGRSLHEVHGTVRIPDKAGWLRRMLAFSGPAYLVSVGYMDPGNWATDLAGGARFGYQLIWVILLSNLMAVLLQTLSARLGVVAGKDLAQECRDYYPRPLTVPLWLLAELAIVACDLAEVLGAAVGLKLLFHLPLLWGVVITSLDVLLLLALSRLGMRRLEAFILTLVATMGLCFAVEIALSRPEIAAILAGFVPRGADGTLSLFAPVAGGWSVLGLHGEALYIAIGILGATVMPHNLYLHSALVQSRAVARSIEGKRQATRMNLIDSAVALNAAFFVNAAILVLAAAVFHSSGHQDVARIEDAYQLLTPLLGTGVASTLFAVALLASGQSSTITGTLAGQVVMEGFLHWRIQPWLRRLISRSLAIIPAVIVIGIKGENSVDELLVLSQVVLSLQLAFAVIPLVTFTSMRSRMGPFVNPGWVIALATLVTFVIVGLNVKLVADSIVAWWSAAPGAWWLAGIVLPVVAAVGLLLLAVAAMPLLRALRLSSLPERIPPVPAEYVSRTGGKTRGPRLVAERGPRRVAVALEIGRADEAVIEHVAGMALPADVQIVLMHVAESAASRYLGVESSDQESREDTATLERLAEHLRHVGFDTRVMLGNGDVKAELARMVGEIGADLLITGSHGHRLFGDLFLGATTSGLRHRVRCPVLAVRTARQ